MSRIPIPTPETMTPEQRRVFEAIRSGPRGSVAGPFPVLLNSPELADCIQRIGEFLRFRSPLPARVREVATLVTARHWASQYEWHAHEPLALKSGLSAKVIGAIKNGRRPEFDAATDQAVYDFSIELHTHKSVSEPTYRNAVDALGAAGVVELTVLNGYYVMLAMTLNAHRVPLPEGVEPPLAT